MGAAGGVDGPGEPGAQRETPVDPGVEALIPLVRRIIRARVPNATTAEDLVQETLVRVLAKANRVAPSMLEPYAIVTAQNLVRSMWIERDRQRRNQHRLLEVAPAEAPDEQLLRDVDAEAVSVALGRLTERERAPLLAHELVGRDTKSLAADLGLTAGAVAAQMNRTRARLRVEYLLALQGGEPPSKQCRPVLLSSPVPTVAARMRLGRPATCWSVSCALL